MIYWNSALIIMILMTLIPGRRIGFGVLIYFPVTWLVGELVIPLLVVQSVLATVMLLKGTVTLIKALSWLVTVVGLLWILWRALRNKQSWSQLVSTPLGLRWVQVLSSFWLHQKGVRRIRNIAYGDDGYRHLLDICWDGDSSKQQRPVLLQIHGGAWLIGRKHQQAIPLLNEMAKRGWLCLDINYRLSPKAKLPTHLQDVKRAIAWAKQHISEYGGDPDCIVITGGSAGGHLASLAALTANQPQWQPGFEQVDTRVAACVPFYGVYDFLDQCNLRGRQSMEKMLAKYVMPATQQQQPDLWQQLSPINHVANANIPFLVVHGTHDSLVFVEEARYFVEQLQQSSTSSVDYVELFGAQHAFEVFHSVRCNYTIQGVAAWLQRVAVSAR